MNSYKADRQIQFKHMVKGVLSGLFSVLFILLILTKVSAAESSDLKLSVTYGFDQCAKYGRYLPVNVTIENNGKEFLGYVQTYASKAGNNVAYEKEIKIKENETKKVSLIIPVMDNSGYLNVNLLNEHKEEIINRQYTLSLGNYDKLMYVGVLSDDFKDLDYLTSYGTKVFHLDESMIPEDYLGLDLLDVLVINQYDTKKLAMNQVAAIAEWIKKGGTLVLGTGEYQNHVLYGFSEDFGIAFNNSSENLTFSFGTDKTGLKELTGKILDYEETRRIFLENLKNQSKMLESYGLDPIIIQGSEQNLWTKEKLNQLHVEEITKIVSDFDVSGGIVVKAVGEEELLTVKEYGLGKIQVFHFDLELSKEYIASGLSILTALRSNISDTKKSLLDNELYGAYMSSGISNYIPHTSSNGKPEIIHYTLIILMYILLSGPALYIILKKLDKRNWYFKLIVALSLVFMAIIYRMGENTRIDKPYMDYIKVSEFGTDNTLTNRLYFSITGNNNRDFEIALSDKYNVKELSQNIPYIYNYQTLKNFDATTIKSSITYKDTITEIKLTGLPAFSPLQFQLAEQETAENKINSSITNIGHGLNGFIKNNFKFDINNAVLLSQGYIVSLGNVTAGEEINLENKYTVFLNVRDKLYQKEVVKKLFQTEGMYEEDEGNRLSGVLEYMMEEDINAFSDKSYLLGFKSDTGEAALEAGVLSDNILADFTNGYDIYGTEIVKLPVEVNYTKGTETFIPTIDSYLVSSDSFYNKYYQARYLNSPETTLTYHFPQQDNITKFSFLRSQNDENISEYLSKFTGTIAFLNVNTGDYEPVFLSGYDQNIYNTQDYLTDENILTIKFSTDMSLKSFNVVLPHISYWKEESYVRN